MRRSPDRAWVQSGCRVSSAIGELCAESTERLVGALLACPHMVSERTSHATRKSVNWCISGLPAVCHSDYDFSWIYAESKEPGSATDAVHIGREAISVEFRCDRGWANTK